MKVSDHHVINLHYIIYTHTEYIHTCTAYIMIWDSQKSSIQLHRAAEHHTTQDVFGVVDMVGTHEIM